MAALNLRNKALVAFPQYDSGAKVSVTVDPNSHATILTVTPDDGNPLVRFRSQLSASDTLGVSDEVEEKRSSLARRSVFAKSSPRPSLSTAPNSA